MATYKAEFMHHHYRRRIRPRAAYAMGLLHEWAPAAGLAPAVVNHLASGRVTAPVAKRLAGIAPEREIPQFASQSFRRSLRDRPPQRRATILLFADTFTDYFHPVAGIAAVRALEAAGYTVAVPRRRLCCGRPLFDFGMLDLARMTLRRTLSTLRPALRAGVPVVVLEPSCLATFRDELQHLLPGQADAAELGRRAVSLAELLCATAGWSPGTRTGDVLLHGHCHHRAVGGFDHEQAALERLGMEVDLPAEGCCGMAGSFGFDRSHLDVSLAIGERELLPAVRAASEETLVVANGFSCREQIRQGTGRRARHIAELLQPD
jgi:Fe-S oxidoreductase